MEAVEADTKRNKQTRTLPGLKWICSLCWTTVVKSEKMIKNKLAEIKNNEEKINLLGEEVKKKEAEMKRIVENKGSEKNKEQIREIEKKVEDLEKELEGKKRIENENEELINTLRNEIKDMKIETEKDKEKLSEIDILRREIEQRDVDLEQLREEANQAKEMEQEREEILGAKTDKIEEYEAMVIKMGEEVVKERQMRQATEKLRQDEGEL